MGQTKIDVTPEGQSKPNQVKLTWVDEPGFELTAVDELQLQIANDRVYLTFGQIRLPVGKEVNEAEIRVVARLVTTPDVLKKIQDLMGRLTKEPPRRDGEQR